MADRARWIRLWSIALTALLANQPGDVFAGKLDRIRSQAHTSSSSSSSGSGSSSGSQSRHSDHHHSHGHDPWCENENSLSEELVGIGLMAALVGVASPIWAPPLLLGDEGGAGFQPDHPYTNSYGGLLLDKSASGAHDTLVLLQGQYGDDFGGVSHANGRLVLESAWRLGIDTEFYYRHEDGSPTDSLWTGDFNVTWRFAQSEPLQFRAGLGFNWLADRQQEDYGFNFTYGADLFPGDPWVLSSTIDWGRLDDATLFHGRTTIGVTRNGWGLYTGYDYFNVGGAGLHSWINGVELRF